MNPVQRPELLAELQDLAGGDILDAHGPDQRNPFAILKTLVRLFKQQNQAHQIAMDSRWDGFIDIIESNQ